MNVSRLESLGWRYKVDLESGLSQTYQWFLANQDNFRK
jgi:GDP-L-fucose synthase